MSEVTFLLKSHAVIYGLLDCRRIRTITSGLLWKNTKWEQITFTSVQYFSVKEILHKLGLSLIRYEGCLHTEPWREPYSLFSVISEPEVRSRTGQDLHFLLVLLRFPVSVLFTTHEVRIIKWNVF